MRTRTRLAALAAVSVVVLAGCGTEDDPQDDASDTGNDPGTSAPTSAPTEDPSSGAPTPSDSGTPETAAVPAYFVGETPVGLRLYREFRSVEADNPVDEVLALISAGDALDPDYSTLLPGGNLTLGQGDTDQTIGVNLPDVGWAERPEGMSAKDAKLAVQQIVYTVQGALGKRLPVEFFYDGLSPIFGLQAPEGFKAGKFYNVLALVNITIPEEGAAVSGTFTASGVASSFEGTVPWEVQDESGAKVLEGFAQAEGYVDNVYPWKTDVDVSGLAPGTYTFVARTDDPSGGEGGSGPQEDTKTITVG